MLSKIVKQIVTLFLTLPLCAVFLFSTQTYSFAMGFGKPYDGVRDVKWNYGDNRCDVKEKLIYNPFEMNKDMAWEPTNPTCISFMVAAGATISITGRLTKSMCNADNPAGRAKMPREQIVEAMYEPDPPIMWARLGAALITRAGRCGERGLEYIAYQSFCAGAPTSPACGFASVALMDVARCCVSANIPHAIAVGVGLSALASIYETAQGAIENARICGHDWQTWSDDINETGKSEWNRGRYGSSYQKCLGELFKGDPLSDSCLYMEGADDTRVLSNKKYREYIYGGKEFSDNGGDECSNPWSASVRNERLGYSTNKQQYYMTGPANASNYACSRFVPIDQTDADAQKAYACCLKRSQNTLCIESRTSFDTTRGNWEHKFCKLGSKCNIGSVWYETFTPRGNSNYICGKTYSVCPYNHMLGGGTEKETYDSEGNLKNYCQVYNHCSKVPSKPYIRFSSLEGAFISAACKDMKGDSQNLYAYNKDLLLSKKRNFSAPMAQCFKETMENMFLNKAGHTKCNDAAEFPNADGVCQSGNYDYKVGDELNENTNPSFFLKIRSSLQDVIKLGLSFSVVALGFNLLLGMSPLTKKQLMGYILKFALVMYFALGNGWQHGFMTGVMNSSTFLADMMFMVDETIGGGDGCQFPRYDEDGDPSTTYLAYPEGKEYLKIWDSLDCKLANAIGFGPEASVPNIAMMILGGFLTGGLGIVFLVASMCMAFFMFSIVIRALHIFILSITGVIIMLYVSPITITLAMFGRTKSIFDGWWKQILGYVLQPVILFAYLGLLLTIFDSFIIGDAEFIDSGPGNQKKISCNVTNPETGAKAADTSIYCIFSVDDNVMNYPGLEPIGVGLPVLIGMNQSKVNTIIKAAIIMFIFMTFLDKITDFSKELVGGAGLSSDWKTSVAGMAGGAYKGLRAVQKRGTGGLGQAASKGASMIRSAGNQGAYNHKKANDKFHGRDSS